MSLALHILFTFLLSLGGINDPEPKGISLMILGTVQDGGSPHAGCQKDCCADLFQNPDPTRKVVCLGIIDKKSQQTFLFEATPDLPEQMKMLKAKSAFQQSETPDGIFLTHAHIGHYTGLMYLGKEAMNAKEVPVYAMPRMQSFLRESGPWSQLVANQNIRLRKLTADSTIRLSENLTVTPLLVPHRDEYSETVGFIIRGPFRSALFIPDIDKWEKWDRDILELIQKVNYAFIDGTFMDAEEIGYRDIGQIPHPFITESMELFKGLPEAEKSKIHFIHFNHTNPALNLESSRAKYVINQGHHLARFGQEFQL